MPTARWQSSPLHDVEGDGHVDGRIGDVGDDGAHSHRSVEIAYRIGVCRARTQCRVQVDTRGGPRHGCYLIGLGLLCFILFSFYCPDASADEGCVRRLSHHGTGCARFVLLGAFGVFTTRT